MNPDWLAERGVKSAGQDILDILTFFIMYYFDFIMLGVYIYLNLVKDFILGQNFFFYAF